MSTNYVTAKYQEIYDINTVSNQISIIGIHTPTGSKPRQLLSGFFSQYRKYRYRGCSLVGTPAQRLGLSMAQLSTEAGESLVNPKDVFNPALFRGCHGDNLNAALNSIYNGSFEQEGSSIGLDDHTWSVVPVGTTSWEQMYYRMLQDPSFRKFNLSSGIKVSKLHPMVYNVASDHQILPNESKSGVGSLVYGSANDGELGIDPSTYGYVATGAGGDSPVGIVYPHLMTNRLQSLGWLDTRQVLNSNTDGIPAFTTLPRIFMGVIVLPPALSSSGIVTSMRFVVTHYFEFKEFNTSLTLEGATEYYDWLTVVSSKGDKALNDTFDTNGENDSVELISDGVF